MAQQTLNTPRETTHQRIADALEDIVDKIVDTSSAGNIDYDNTESGLDATKVQGAVDELASEKVDKVQGKGLSTNDYTDTEKQKLAGIEAGANKTVVDSAINDRSTNPLQNRVITAALDEKTDVSNFNALTQEIELFNTYDLTNDVEISVFANDTYKRDKYDRAYETHIPNLDGEYSVSLGDKTFTETCTFTIANEGKSITETFHTNRKYILGAKLLKAENDEVGDMHVIADVVTLLISKDAPYTTTFDPYLEHPPATGVLTLKVSVKPDEKYVTGTDEPAFWGSYNGSDLLINNPILTYSETTFGQPKVSGNPITINDAAEANLVECVAKVEAVQEGSGDPSPTNIRPISGRSEVAIQRVGKNLISNIEQNAYNSNASTYEANYRCRTPIIKINGGESYVFSFATNQSKTVEVLCQIWKSNNYGSNELIEEGQYTRESMSIQKTSDTYVSFIFRYSDNAIITPNQLTAQLEKSNTATTYEPYAGKTYTIQFGQTVYGGTLDATKGELVVDRASVDLGTLNWRYSVADVRFFTTDIKDIKKVMDATTVMNGLCSHYDIVAYQYVHKSTALDGVMGVYSTSTTNYLAIKDTRYTDATSFKSAVTGQPLVYELATPYTIKLTPQQIKLLKGTNNITCNTGDLSIKYYPDNVLGQLKGDIESEYDAIIQNLLERIEALENQQ